jgi:carbamoylphosphate synthase small subunit
VWTLAILAVIGTIGRVVERLRRPAVSPPTGQESEQIEIGEISEQWIQVVKILRDHQVIEKPHELARESPRTVVAVDPGEVEAVIRQLAERGIAVRRVGSGRSSSE